MADQTVMGGARRWEWPRWLKLPVLVGIAIIVFWLVT